MHVHFLNYFDLFWSYKFVNFDPVIPKIKFPELKIHSIGKLKFCQKKVAQNLLYIEFFRRG